MKSISCLTALLTSLFVFSAQSSNAQVSVYGSAALTDFVFFTGQTNVAKSDTGGFILGAFYNFPIDSRLTAGVDAHLSDGFGQRGGTTGAVSLRIGFVPHQSPLRPYFELGGAVVSSSQAIHTSRITNGAAEFAAGLDIRLTHSLDLRAVELGAAAPASNSSSTKAGSAFLDAGVVYHFH